MSQNFKKLKALHQSDSLFLLPNIWNAKSALLFQELKFPAIATSSMAVANSLGYEDGENMSFSEYLFVIKRISSSIQIPLSVDMEMGYGSTNEKIYANIQKLIGLGVAGINIEDSALARSGRVLKNAKTHAKTIEQIKNKLSADGLDLFINIRCDTYILNVKGKLQETIIRLKTYESTGADGIFLPGIFKEKDILTAARHTRLPLNVMCVAGLPDFDTLNRLGVKRVSMGPFMFDKIYSNIAVYAKAFSEDKSIEGLLS
jgi:2-methylisocitrate lyase-like PEP mutase family enzyme